VEGAARSFILLAAGGLAASRLKTDFFKDLSYLYTLMCAAGRCTALRDDEAARRAEEVVREAAQEYARRIRERWEPREVLNHLPLLSVARPRFWFSVSPELQS